jgi:signal transduction histidine kinase
MKNRAMRDSSRRASYVVVALSLTMVLAVVLALLVQSTARYHRGTAESVLRDYASFAAEQYANRAQQRLASTIYPVLNLLTQTGTARPGARLPDRASLQATGQGAQVLRSATALFRIELPDGTLRLAGADSGADLRRWVSDTLRREALTVYHKDWYLALVWQSGPSASSVLAYTVGRDSAGLPKVAYGFVVLTDSLAREFREVGTRAPLLPASLTGGVVVDSVAAVRVSSVAGRTLYVSELRSPSPFRGVKNFDPIWGGLAVEVSLRPSVADRLIIGGLPKSRLPLLLGLVGLTGLLVVTAMLQLRREQELTRLRGDFVASVSHELRTPLAQLRMFTETLLLGRVRSDTERRRSLEILDQEARRLTHLVDNLLYVARGERSSAPLAPEETELGPAVREIAESFAPLAASRGSSVSLKLEDGVRARVDRNALRQILLNLLENAVKYGRAGAPVLVGVERNGDAARLRVEDRGPGVPSADRERIWRRFARLDRDIDSAVAGSGIGLAIVRDLVLAHGGSCRVEDAPEGGARFVVELPG